MASNVENLLSWVLWKVPLRKVRYMNRKLKLDKWFFWKIWEPRLCLDLFFEWSLILGAFVSPDSLKQNSNWLGQVHTVPFSINFLTCNQILFSFSLLHHSNGKGKARHTKDSRGFQERPKAGHVIALRSLHIPGWEINAASYNRFSCQNGTWRTYLVVIVL